MTKYLFVKDTQTGFLPVCVSPIKFDHFQKQEILEEDAGSHVSIKHQRNFR